MNEQDIERQISLMENSENWSIYRDHEKRAIAFRAGVEFANTRAPVASGVALSGVKRWSVSEDEWDDEVSFKESETGEWIAYSDLATLPSQPVEPVAGQASDCRKAFEEWYGEEPRFLHITDAGLWPGWQAAWNRVTQNKLAVIYERCVKALASGNEDVMALTDICNIIEHNTP